MEQLLRDVASLPNTFTLALMKSARHTGPAGQSTITSGLLIAVVTSYEV